MSEFSMSFLNKRLGEFINLTKIGNYEKNN